MSWVPSEVFVLSRLSTFELSSPIAVEFWERMLFLGSYSSLSYDLTLLFLTAYYVTFVYFFLINCGLSSANGNWGKGLVSSTFLAGESICSSSSSSALKAL